MLGLLKSLWLQELSSTKAVEELGDFWCVLSPADVIKRFVLALVRFYVP